MSNPVIFSKAIQYVYLKKNGSHHFRRPLLTPWSHMDYVYDRWRRFFWFFQISGTIHSNYQAWKRIFFLI